jgi:septum site-determining protein MinC
LKTKQYSAKIFEITLEDEDKFISFFDKNYLFFQNSFIIIHGKENDKIKNYMDSKELKFAFNLSIPKQKTKKQDIDLSEETPTKQKTKKTNLKVLDKLIRSGQEINIDGDLLLLNRVNSGGSIIINGILIITQIVDGSIRCDGDFMMLQASSKANIVFHGVEVDNKFLQDRLNRVELIKDEIRITPALKETNWV